jgi:hypothetical protein
VKGKKKKEARRMSGREINSRGMLLAFMGHVLLENYGIEALDLLERWIHERTRERWKEIAVSTGRNDPEYLLRLFSNEVHDFEVIRKDKKILEVKVKKCIWADVFRKLNAADIGRKLICSGDEAVTEGFNPNIRFRRPKLLMIGDDSCHFIWELQA